MTCNKCKKMFCSSTCRTNASQTHRHQCLDIDNCATCGNSGAKKCAACKRVAYCNRACQELGWQHHKHVCHESVDSLIESSVFCDPALLRVLVVIEKNLDLKRQIIVVKCDVSKTITIHVRRFEDLPSIHHDSLMTSYRTFKRWRESRLNPGRCVLCIAGDSRVHGLAYELATDPHPTNQDTIRELESVVNGQRFLVRSTVSAFGGTLHYRLSTPTDVLIPIGTLSRLMDRGVAKIYTRIVQLAQCAATHVMFFLLECGGFIMCNCTNDAVILSVNSTCMLSTPYADTSRHVTAETVGPMLLDILGL